MALSEASGLASEAQIKGDRGGSTDGSRLEVIIDGSGVVRAVRGDLALLPLIQPNRLILDQAASWSLAFRQFLARTLEGGAPSSAAYLLKAAGRAEMMIRAGLAPEGDGTWRLLIDRLTSSVSHDLALDAYDLQERMGLVDLLMDVAVAKLDLSEILTDSLPWIMRSSGMEAAGFFAAPARATAELSAAYGKTRKRGFPYPEINLLGGVFRPLLGSRILELEDDGGDAGLRAVTCRGARQIVLVPAAWAGTMNGVLVLSRRVRQQLLSEELQSLLTVGRLLGQLARIGYLSARSQQSSAVLGTAYAVSRAISQSLDLDHTFKQIAFNATRLMAGSRCLLLELDPLSRDLVAVASSEPDDELVGLRLRFQDVGRLAAGYLELEIDELVYSAQISPTFRTKLHMESAVLLPMLAQNELVGSLLLFSSGPSGHFAKGDLALAAEVAEQAAMAIHNARLYRDLAESRASIEGLVERIARVREHERREAATILHDDVLQSVIGVLYELEGLRGSLAPEASAQMEHPLTVLRSAIDDARVVISDLRPPQLDQLGFGAALRALVARADATGPPRVDISLDGMPDLEPMQASALYRIARQALVNAQRHAQARNVRVSTLSEARDGATWVVLAVADDGIGMTPLPPGDSRHFGLAMMEEQAALAGGNMEFRDRPGGGTVVAVHMPVRSA